MPPKQKVTKQDIIRAAFEITREKGAQAINARAVAARLGISTQPIFSNYSSMEELKADVIVLANGLYQSYLERDMNSGEYPVYKASGIAYIRFAKEEKELFRLLFMRDRSRETIRKDSEEIRPLLDIIQRNTGLPEQEAFLFHLEMWTYVHGIAVMLATNYLELDWALISRMMTDSYEGIKMRFLSKEEP